MGLAAAQEAIGPANQADVLHLGLDNGIFQPLYLFQQEMLQGDVGIAHPHKGVQVGAAQISIDEDHLFAQLSKANPQAQGDHAFADAPLAAPDAPELDFAFRQCLPLRDVLRLTGILHPSPEKQNLAQNPQGTQ